MLLIDVDEYALKYAAFSQAHLVAKRPKHLPGLDAENPSTAPVIPAVQTSADMMPSCYAGCGDYQQGMFNSIPNKQIDLNCVAGKYEDADFKFSEPCSIKICFHSLLKMAMCPCLNGYTLFYDESMRRGHTPGDSRLKSTAKSDKLSADIS